MNIELTCFSCGHPLYGNIMISGCNSLCVIAPVCQCAEDEPRDRKISNLSIENKKLRDTCEMLDKQLKQRTRSYEEAISRFKGI